MAAASAAADSAIEDADKWSKAAEGYKNFSRSRGYHGLDMAALKPGESFLDVATGAGDLAIAAAEKGANVTAIDFSPGMINVLKSTLAERTDTLPLTALVMDGQNLGIEDSTFDAVHSSYAVGLFPDYEKGVQEMARVTKPGGRVVIVSPGDEGRSALLPWARVLEGQFQETCPLPIVDGFKIMGSSTGMRQVLEAAGLVDVEIVEATSELRWEDPARSAKESLVNPFMMEIQKRMTPRRWLEVEQALCASFEQTERLDDGSCGYKIISIIGYGKKPA